MYIFFFIGEGGIHYLKTGLSGYRPPRAHTGTYLYHRGHRRRVRGWNRSDTGLATPNKAGLGFTVLTDATRDSRRSPTWRRRLLSLFVMGCQGEQKLGSLLLFFFSGDQN